MRQCANNMVDKSRIVPERSRSGTAAVTPGRLPLPHADGLRDRANR
jgi:hypothetical protein